MKVERKTNHTARAQLARQVATESGSAEYRKIFLAMADGEDAIE